MKTKITIRLTLFITICLSIPGLLQAQQLNKKVFDLIQLDSPGLSEVKKAYEQNDLHTAAQALLEYFRNRTNIIHPELDPANVTASAGDRQKADDALVHKLYAHEGYQPSFYYGQDIDWKYWPIKDNELRWQLHRQKWFISMGKMYYTTGDGKYAEEWTYQYMDWIKKNPLITDMEKDAKQTHSKKTREDIENARFAWRPLEVGTRLEDQTQQFLLFKKATTFTPEFLTEFLVNYHKHASYLLHNFSKTGNHLLFEAQQILYAGIFFPEYKDAAIWRKSGIGILVREAGKQVYEDGGQFELDPLYHMASIEIFCKALMMADVNGARNEFPGEFPDTIKKMIVFYYNICYPDYTNPCFSDAKRRGKEGKLKNYRIWARLFPEDKQIRYFATEGQEGKLPGNLSKGFLNSGFFTFRNGWQNDATVMVIKAGPKGEWHNQPDNGTFELWFNGSNLFPDTGFYIYGGDDRVMKLRNWFRQTMVHQTLTLDNKNLETQSSITRLWKPKGNTQILVTENQSYKELKHRRSVFFVDQKYFVIADEAVGNATGKIGLHYQMNAGKVNVDPQNFTLTSHYEGKSNAKLQCFTPAGTTLEEEEGWQATLYLVREKRTAVSFNVIKKEKTPIRYITVIYPGEDCGKIPEISAKFVDKQYDEKSLKIEVLLDGVKKVLRYRL